MDRAEYLRIRFTRSFLTHLWKALRRRQGRHVLPRVSRYVRPGSTVVDVGANTGHFSYRLAQSAPDVTVLAFEPQSYARFLMRLSGLLRPAGTVWIFPFALGAEAGLAFINVPVKRGRSFGTGLAHLGSGSHLARRFPVVRELVAVQTLDAVLAQLDVPPVSFVKIDVEGFELFVLRGAQDMIDRDRPVVLAETPEAGNFGYALQDLEAFFRSRKYAMLDPLSGRRLERLSRDVPDTLFVPEERVREGRGGFDTPNSP